MKSGLEHTSWEGRNDDQLKEADHQRNFDVNYEFDVSDVIKILVDSNAGCYHCNNGMMTSGLVDECRDIKGCNIIKIMSYIRIMGKPYDKANNYFRKYFMSYPAVCFLSLSFLPFFFFFNLSCSCILCIRLYSSFYDGNKNETKRMSDWHHNVFFHWSLFLRMLEVQGVVWIVAALNVFCESLLN